MLCWAGPLPAGKNPAIVEKRKGCEPEMTEAQYRNALSCLRRLAGAGHGLLSAEEVVGTALHWDPEVTEEEVFALIKELGPSVQLVEQNRKNAILESLAPRKQGEEWVDLSLMDKMLMIVLQKEMPPALREEWYARLAEKEPCGQILKERPHREPAALAKSLGLTLPELYLWEREIYDLYYRLARNYGE